MLKVHERVIAPDLLLNFLAGYDLAGMAGEHGQKSKRLGRQFDEGSILAQLFRIEI
ncbi:MAG: hypothetical protein ABSE85_08080 [Candidatus Korobacteraceae bacterium]